MTLWIECTNHEPSSLISGAAKIIKCIQNPMKILVACTSHEPSSLVSGVAEKRTRSKIISNFESCAQIMKPRPQNQVQQKSVNRHKIKSIAPDIKYEPRHSHAKIFFDSSMICGSIVNESASPEALAWRNARKRSAAPSRARRAGFTVQVPVSFCQVLEFQILKF